MAICCRKYSTLYTGQKCATFSEKTSRIPSYTQNAYRIPFIPVKKVSHFLRKGLVYSRIPRIPSYTRIPSSELRDTMQDPLTEARIPSYTWYTYCIPRILCIPAKNVLHFQKKILVYPRIPKTPTVYPVYLVYLSKRCPIF